MIYISEIIQKDKDGNEIARYPSLMKAVEATGYNIRHIQNVCEGKAKTHKGYIWEYGERIVKSRAVAIYDLRGNLIEAFPSVRDAWLSDTVRKTGMSTTLKFFKETVRCVKNQRDASYLGFMWRSYPADQQAPEKILPFICKIPNYHVGEQFKRGGIVMKQNGKVIRVYKDIDEAKRDFPDLDDKILNYKRELFGCTFERLSVDPHIRIADRGPTRGGKPRGVRRFNMHGELIAEYPSIRQAAMAIDGDRRHLYRALNGERKSYGGSYWEYMSV